MEDEIKTVTVKSKQYIAVSSVIKQEDFFSHGNRYSIVSVTFTKLPSKKELQDWKNELRKRYSFVSDSVTLRCETVRPLTKKELEAINGTNR